jgi:hypothetical protein
MRRIVVFSLGFLLLVGCAPKRSPSGVVSGTITYKGQPVNSATLLLHPATGTGGSFPIAVSEDGTFQTSDVPPGDYKVVVQGRAADAGVPAATKDMTAEMKEKYEKLKGRGTIPFPDKYKQLTSTDLKTTVGAGKQALTLELKD